MTDTDWPMPANVSRGELIGMARERSRYADELNRNGLWDDAWRHWLRAEAYMDRAREMDR